uniref:Intraflagellar transport protein 46 homolog n=1 Tax=Alexandrium monilatum TaxID=311494 RepID=A0A7S4W8R2_9DINO
MARRGLEKEDIVSDREYDEAIPVESDDDDELSTPASSEMPSPSSQKSPAAAGMRGAPQRGGGGKQSVDDDDDESESGESGSSEATSTSDSSDGGEDGMKGKSAAPVGGYNPDEFKGMKVSPDVEELFQYITRYKPHTIELDTSLKPFIPELIPSIGEVDAFIKMPRPDAQPSNLGTTRLDEPTMNPSDPSILDLQLRSLSKNQDLQPMEVRSIENAEKCPKEIENWIRRIDDLNRSKPAPTVQYSRRMPDIEQLMQVWPAEFEEYLQQNPLPDLADLELDLPSYIRIFASILDVPVYSQITESLHVIFTLYSEFKSNQHFSKTDNAGNFGGPDPYSFPAVPNFTQGPASSVSPGAAGGIFGGPPMESIAPSRAPSPVGQNQGQMQM